MKKGSIMFMAGIFADSINDIIHLICLLIAKHCDVLQYF
mgnify:CR=1 FL=1